MKRCSEMFQSWDWRYFVKDLSLATPGQGMFAPVQLEGAATRRAAKVQELKDLVEAGLCGAMRGLWVHETWMPMQAAATLFFTLCAAVFWRSIEIRDGISISSLAFYLHASTCTVVDASYKSWKSGDLATTLPLWSSIRSYPAHSSDQPAHRLAFSYDGLQHLTTAYDLCSGWEKKTCNLDPNCSFGRFRDLNRLA